MLLNSVFYTHDPQQFLLLTPELKIKFTYTIMKAVLINHMSKVKVNPHVCRHVLTMVTASLKRIHEVQRLISRGIRDIHNWVRDVFWADNSKCLRTRVARRLRTNVYSKVANRFWIKPRFIDFQQHGNKIRKFFKISTKFNTETLSMF